MKYTVELTEEQMRVTQSALEEYFRLRLGQEWDFCDDMATLGRDMSPDNPNHKRMFDEMICRRNHLQEIMKSLFRVAFEPVGHLRETTQDMMIAECIWDAIRYARGISRYSSSMHIGKEPVPVIRAKSQEDDNEAE